jgi:hypothetical protein
MSVYDRIRSILSCRETQSINFKCQGVKVNAVLFARVRSAVGNTDIRSPIVSVSVNRRFESPGVNRNGFLPLGRPSDVSAEYDPSSNTIRVPNESLITIFEEATVVHEAVHCGFDLDYRSNWLWYGQEACAYIAGARFALNKGVTIETQFQWGQIFGVAARVAHNWGSAEHGHEVSWQEYFPLRQAILECPTYRGYDRLCYENNGP